MNNDRYLPLFFGANSKWIERPDLYLLARMGADDNEDDTVVRQIYTAMLQANNLDKSLNRFEQSIEKRHVRGDLRLRLFAGQTLLEMIRISATTRRAPSATQAIRLTAKNQLSFTKKSSTESLEREIRRGFSSFRNTAHFQAAMVIGDPSVEEIEGSEEETTRFLARARGLELFVDSNVTGPNFKWIPWRVPTKIAPETKIELPSLNEEERRAVW